VFDAADLHAESSFRAGVLGGRHPFCVGWGHATRDDVTAYVSESRRAAAPDTERPLR